jgi:hypothetical protein
MRLIDCILILGAIMAALAVAAICVLGIVVWLAGGRLGRRDDHNTV